MKVERNRAGNRYTFNPEDEKDEKFLDRIGKLEEENKKLNEEIENHKQNIMQDELEIIPKLEEENEKLNKKIEKLQIEIGGLMGERDGLQMIIERLHKEIAEQEAEGFGLFDEIEYRKRECKKLKEELKKYKKLHKYSNGELLTYSGD